MKQRGKVGEHQQKDKMMKINQYILVITINVHGHNWPIKRNSEPRKKNPTTYVI